jgi:hypothetical protein
MVSSLLHGISRLERPGDKGATLDAKTDLQGQAVLTRSTLPSIGTCRRTMEERKELGVGRCILHVRLEGTHSALGFGAGSFLFPPEFLVRATYLSL